ncbi:MAG: hypothetical protein PHE61_02710 [Candidatus Omnitrophica bacterium]|nr:hypothetical protein [Candidatus Omnitrophota bacterium]
MRKLVYSLFVISLAVVLSGAWTPMADNQRMFIAIGKEFAATALETLMANTGEKSADAARWYRDLAENTALGNTAVGTYYELDGHANFGAQVADYIFRGGANEKRTRSVMTKCAVSYGKALAQVFSGKKISGVSQEFMMNFTYYLDQLQLNPDDYNRALSRARYQFSTLNEIEKKKK